MSSKKQIKYPDCWDDDTRMNALFQPFRPKQVNPKHYTAKLEFWQNSILEFCKILKNNPTFTLKEIQLAYKRKDKQTLCLETVVEEMLAQKLIKRKDEILNNPYNTWTMWAINSFVKSPVKWGLNKVWLASKKESDELEYIHLPLLKELSTQLFSLIEKHPGKILTIDSIRDMDSNLSEDGLNICLLNLYHQKKLILDFEITKEEIKIKLVKIPGKNDPKNKLTETDKTLLELQNTKIILLKQTNEMEKEILEIENSARKCVREKNQRMAKVHLKKKQLLQNNYDKKSDILHNIETLITNIEDAQNNGEILNAYKLGSDTLKSLMSKTGLSLENVDEIMSTMKETIDTHGEIQDSLASFNDSVSLDDTALERELEEMLSEETPKVAEDNKEKQNKKDAELENELIELLEKLEVVATTPKRSPLSSKPSSSNAIVEN